MKVSVKDGKTCEKILQIELGKEEIAKEFDEYYKAVAPKAKVPGFRPGKVPRDVLMMHYGNDARETVLKHLISESYGQAIQEKSLEPLGYPQIDAVKFDENKLSYEAKIEIRPKIKLSRTTGLTAKKEKAEVKPEEIADSLKRMQESLAKFKAVEDRPAALGDFVIADYVCFVNGKEVEKRNDDWFELREDEFLKGFSAQLVGAKPGDEKEVQINFPESGAKPEWAGKPSTFKLKIKEIKMKVLPELNDDLAKDAGDFQSLQELKAKIEKDILAAKEREKEIEFENTLLTELVQHNKIDLPGGLVERRFEHLIDEAKQKFLRHGATEADFEKQKETLRPQLEAEAKRQVHLAFLLEEIAAKENITVTEADFKDRYQRIAERIHQQADHIEEYYSKHEDSKEALKDQIRNEKAIEFVKQNAKVKS